MSCSAIPQIYFSFVQNEFWNFTRCSVSRIFGGENERLLADFASTALFLGAFDRRPVLHLCYPLHGCHRRFILLGIRQFKMQMIHSLLNYGENFVKNLCEGFVAVAWYHLQIALQLDIICNFFTGFHLDGYYFDTMYLIARCGIKRIQSR